MTFREFMQENGYDLMTTFWEDFSIADKYGIAGVKDTYRRAFNEWKDDYKFFTELTYYSHTNTLSFNWGSYEKKITQEEFDDFVKNVDRSKLPEGIKFELK